MPQSSQRAEGPITRSLGLPAANPTSCTARPSRSPRKSSGTQTTTRYPITSAFPRLYFRELGPGCMSMPAHARRLRKHRNQQLAMSHDGPFSLPMAGADPRQVPRNLEQPALQNLHAVNRIQRLLRVLHSMLHTIVCSKALSNKRMRSWECRRSFKS